MEKILMEDELLIINNFGEEFYKKIKLVVQNYSNKWQLSNFSLIHSFSVNCVFKCVSNEYGNALLKISKNNDISYELNALLEYKGEKFCNIYHEDSNNGIILEELILSGETLKKEQSLDSRLTIFSELYKGLHIRPKNYDLYPTYLHWVTRITKFMEEQTQKESHIKLYNYMKKSEQMCINLWGKYPDKKLLHGDFHHFNILKCDNVGYKIIDPKGVIGPIIFDIPRFILNEVDEVVTNATYEKINYCIIFLAKKLDICEKDLRQSFFIETTMSQCWNVEDNMEICLDYVELAERLLKC